MFRKLCFVALVALTIVKPAHAETNAEILQSMSINETGIYIASSVNMMAFMTYLHGNKRGYKCILDWFFGNRTSAQQVVEVMHRLPDETPQTMLFAMVTEECGDPRGSGK